MAASQTKALSIDDPSDWPTDVKELRTLDSLLRCSICFEFFNSAVTATGCYHNYCSLCALTTISYKADCPSCHAEMRESHLKSNRVLDEIVRVFTELRPKLLSILKEYKHLKLREKGNLSATSNVRRKKRALQQSNEGGETAETYIGSEAASKQVESSGIDKDEDCQLKIVRKRNEVGDGFAGSSTSTLSDNESRVADDLKHEKEPSTRRSRIDEKHPESKKTSSSKLPKKRLQFTTEDNSNTGEPVVKRRRLRSEDNTSGNVPLCAEAAFEVSSDMEARSILGNEVNGAFSSQDHCTFPKAASNDLLPIREGESRKKLPNLVISGLSDKQLRKKLKEYGLSSKGDKKLLQSRLKNFYLLYNSQCDAINPMSVSDIKRQVESTEAIQKKLDKGRVLVQTFDLSKSDKEKQELNVKHSAKHREQYESLINEVKARSKRGGQTAVDNTLLATDEVNQTTSQLTNKPSALNPDLPVNTSTSIKEKESAGYTSSFSEDDNQQLSSIDPVERMALEENPARAILCRTPQRCSRSGEKSTFYLSPEYKAIQMLAESVTKVIPVVEKLHADFCRNNISPSKCICNCSTSVEKINDKSPKHEDEFEHEDEVEHEACIKTGSHGGSPSKDSNLVVISDEEVNLTIELNQKHRVQGTPLTSAAYTGAENTGSPLIGSPVLSLSNNKIRGSKILSSSPILSTEGRFPSSQGRKTIVSNSRKGKSIKGMDGSKRDAKKRQKNISVSGRNKIKLKSTEESPKINSGSLKKRQCKSQNITSFFSKVDEDKRKTVGKKSENFRHEASASSSALFDTSSSGESDFEVSFIKIDQSSQKRAKMYESKSDEISGASQSSSLNKVPGTTSHTQLAESDSDDDFMPKFRRSSESLRIISDSSLSSDEFVLRRSRSSKSRTKSVGIDSQVSPMVHSTPRTVDAPNESTHSSELDPPGNSADSNETFTF